MKARVFAAPAALFDAAGAVLGPTEWLTVTQEMIDLFARATGDHQWIHVDVERAKTGPFGGTIAHGYLTMSLVNHFLPEMIEVRGVSMGVNVGADRMRFLSPVPAGSRLRGRGEIIAIEEIKGAVQATIRVTLERDGTERPACTIDTISRYFPEGA
ncbi:MaoC family dehydratase [Sphingomonas sp. So64.6b]|uniref:MaoC family dehydratase n=1 Tax=Sphingomonas sp. So64.6b TaxID=2997354 RepID=UPI0016007BD2|nr:MaoC family dehydratase [Sphingomonas sp. So64.6b]QNA86622.1 MaoC family dehydratase [Sphingomonas sp. So64.6b]